MEKIYEKLENLKKYLFNLGNVCIAFSGGVDSTFLLKVAFEELGEKVIAVTAHSDTYPERELNESKEFTKKNGIKHIVFKSNEFSLEEFVSNPPNRCYICKKELFLNIVKIAKDQGITNIIEGTNADDTNDYRPGTMALNELGILSPLKAFNLTKEEIRILSKEMNLPTWEKPSFACLATRLPYGETITKEKLQMIGKAEQSLMNYGFKQVRVRYHSNMARIELQEEDFTKIIQKELREEIYLTFKEIGFDYISLDLKGYRTGSMNETLTF